MIHNGEAPGEDKIESARAEIDSEDDRRPHRHFPCVSGLGMRDNDTSMGKTLPDGSHENYCSARPGSLTG
jgi:hypothetical protein